MKICEDGICRNLTPEEIIKTDSVEILPQEKIGILKQHLEDSDYKAIKYAEGLICEEDYLPVKTQRQLWRDEINRLEETL